MHSEKFNLGMALTEKREDSVPICLQRRLGCINIWRKMLYLQSDIINYLLIIRQSLGYETDWL
jgi:hypothetical protein